MYTSREKIELALLFVLALALATALMWLATRQPPRVPSGVRIPTKQAPSDDQGSRFA